MAGKRGREVGVQVDIRALHSPLMVSLSNHMGGEDRLGIALTVNGYVINFAKSDGGGMNRRGFVIAMRLLGLGWYVAIAIILGIAGGIWLDNRMGTLPLFTLLGVLLGTVAAFYGLYRMVEPLFNVNEQTDDQ